MLQSFKRNWLVLVLLLAGGQSVFGFALLGPGTSGNASAFNEAYQQQIIGYNEPVTAAVGDDFPADIGTPKNFGQGYRWNVPTVYYAFDASFISYFGSNGVAAVDKAFGIMNGLSNVTSYSADLHEWPYDTRRVKPAAANVGLLDLKSQVLAVLLEELGLASPDRYVWALHDRDTTGLVCPNFNYLVIQRNFDPTTRIYSSFVNNTLYGYVIEEFCLQNPNPVAPLLADAIELASDPSTVLSSLASQSLVTGTYYTSLTRDDVGGLRQLYSATNVIMETAPTNTVLVSTNANLQNLSTLDLRLFLAQAATNSAAALTALYPGLIITATNSFLTNAVTTNFVPVASAIPNAPAGFFQIVLTPVLTTNVQTNFQYTFGNVVVVHSYNAGFTTIQQTGVSAVPGAPAGTVQTNIVSSTIFSAFTNGDFYILPAGLCGPFQIVGTNFIQVIATTNTFTVSNPLNLGGGIALTFNTVNYFTNYQLAVHEVDCITNTATLRQGVEKITFVRRDFDSFIGTNWPPITNVFTLVDVTNGVAVTNTYRRIVTSPDILFTTADLTAGPSAPIAASAYNRSVPNWNTSEVPVGQPGPGTINPGVSITLNIVGPFFENQGAAFIQPGFAGTGDRSGFSQGFRWGSFDGTTNNPIVYPDTTSWANFEAQIYFQIITTTPIAATVGMPFSLQVAASGGTPITSGANKPYAFSLDPNSPALPSGLSGLTTGALSGGLIVGTPTVAGTFSVLVQATDAGGRVTEKAITITVAP